ncbi:MAG: hypothetical protein AAFY98_10620 [Verrucomicrobiota bacterium]
MNNSPHSPTSGRVRLFSLLVLSALCVSAVISLWAQIPSSGKPVNYPDWWFERGVIVHDSSNNPLTYVYPDDYAEADDYAAINQGQLKFIALKGYLELKETLVGVDWATSGTPGYLLEQLVLGWYTDTSDPDPANWIVDTSSSDHYAVANLGQVKYISSLFYDVLALVNYTAGNGYPPSNWTTGSYPWSNSANPADDYAAANLGQVKYLFSWDLVNGGWTPPIPGDPEDLDSDGLPDSFEMVLINLVIGDGIESLADVDAEWNGSSANKNWDFDGDGFSNYDEWVADTLANDPLSMPTPVTEIPDDGTVSLTIF